MNSPNETTGMEFPTESQTEDNEGAAMREAGEKRERAYQNALTRVCEQYPALKEKIMSSLETPQLGDHHKEGPTMESHLKLIMSTMCDISEGKFHEVIAENPKMRSVFDRVVHGGNEEGAQISTINPELENYVFFHDIDKQSTLLFKFEGEKEGAEVTLGDWLPIAKEGPPYVWNGKTIKSISYYHPSEGAVGAHGVKGAETLKDFGLSRVMLTGIAKHEVAYSFSGISAATYEKHFVQSALSEDEQDFVFVASYIDTMSSLCEYGKPDMKNYENFLHSRENYLLIQQAIADGIDLREGELKHLMNSRVRLSMRDIAGVVTARQERESRHNAPW